MLFYGCTVRFDEPNPPFGDCAVMVVVNVLVTRFVPKVNAKVDWPAGTLTEVGTDAIIGLEFVNVISMPPAGAGPSRVKVHRTVCRLST